MAAPAMAMAGLALPPQRSRLQPTTSATLARHPTAPFIRSPLRPAGSRRRTTSVVVASVTGAESDLGTGAAVSAGALALVIASKLTGGDDKDKGEGGQGASAVEAGLEAIKNTPDYAMAGQKKWVKLAAAVLIDIAGVASFALPGVGELGDVAWAPLSAVLVQALFNNRLISLLDFVEEALPFSDIFPTATFGWSIEYTLVGAALSWVPGFPKPDKEESK